jgi:hypothetical protein
MLQVEYACCITIVGNCRPKEAHGYLKFAVDRTRSGAEWRSDALVAQPASGSLFHPPSPRSRRWPLRSTPFAWATASSDTRRIPFTRCDVSSAPNRPVSDIAPVWA